MTAARWSAQGYWPLQLPLIFFTESTRSVCALALALIDPELEP